ncbi:MAG TPA: ATP synthase F1 subunit delta [Planctomycetaceae bacterium]|nr:ATP synthase F1 subunit delta [Planctomycetaceae bacterium]HRF01796.1 ATP synthase F1 subunit delta [Pirellulaceae bacterium]
MSATDSNLAYDTERQYLGTVYAKGLLGSAAKSGDVDAVLAELDEVVERVLPALPPLRALLESPRVPLAVKESVIDRSFASGSDELRRFLKVVCLHGRFDCLKVIDTTARRLRQEQRKVVSVQVTSASPIADDDRPALARDLAAKFGRQVEVQYAVDPALLGGLVVRLGDTVYDGSIANQLEQVRRTAVDRAALQIRQTLDRFAADA